MTPVKQTKPVEVRAPRKAYFKIHEGWLQITPPNQDDHWRIRLSDVIFYRLKKNELIVVGRGIAETLKPQQFSDAERDDECREMLEKLNGMLDLYFSLDNTKIEANYGPAANPPSHPYPTTPPVSNDFVAAGCEKFSESSKSDDGPHSTEA